LNISQEAQNQFILLLDNIKNIALPTFQDADKTFVGPAVVSGVGNTQPVDGFLIYA
jgi:hypothetical protein